MNTPIRQAGAAPASEFAESQVFTFGGRIGRLRLLAYIMGLSFTATLVIVAGIVLATVVLGAPQGEDSQVEAVAGTVGFAIGLGIAMVSLVFSVRRLHDMDFSGWWVLVLLIPFINAIFSLVLTVMPGTKGANRFGPPPAPNSMGVILLAFSFILVPLLGIVAAVAIPSYQDYVARAGVVQGLAAVAPLKERIAQAAAAGQALPQDMSELGLQDDASTLGPTIESVTLTAPGVLAITFHGISPAIDGKVVLLSPQQDAGGRVIGWQCSSGEMKSIYLPGTCKY